MASPVLGVDDALLLALDVETGAVPVAPCEVPVTEPDGVSVDPPGLSGVLGLVGLSGVLGLSGLVGLSGWSGWSGLSG